MFLYLNFTNKDHIYTTATCSWQTKESFANIFIKLFLSLSFPSSFACLQWASIIIHQVGVARAASYPHTLNPLMLLPPISAVVLLYANLHQIYAN